MAHALPLRNDFLREHSAVLGASVVVHALLLVLLGLNLDLLPRRDPQPVRLAIQATVVDNRAARQRAAEQQRRERDARLAQERRRQEQAEQREREQEQEQRRAEQQRAERERVAEQSRLAEQKRLKEAAALKQKADQERRQQQAEQARVARAEQQRQAAEAEKRAAESRRKAEAERRQAQTRADLARQMAEEEELLAAADSGLLDQYAEVIRQKVERNWIRPASARPGISCVVLVKQIPGGDVVDVRVTECNGDAAVVRSIEAAVLRSSPLPPPPDPKLFDRSLRFEFRPAE